jgi:ABC-type multidrug transport system ATPase subunit
LDAGARTIREMSMGQRRRVMLASALIATPPIIILDEPLETLDAEMRAFVPEWVGALRSAGHTILIATHERAPFEALVDRVIEVRAGRLW